MKRFKRGLAYLFLIGFLQTESWRLLLWADRELATSIITPFVLTDEKILVLWYIKFMCEDMLWMIVMFIVCKVSYMFSFQLFRVSLVFTLYKFVDMVMFFLNFKRWENFYLVLLGLCVIAVACILYPGNEKGAVIKSLE